MTIMEALQWANNRLKKAQIDSAMLDAEILLSHVVQEPKPWLFAHFTDELKPHQQEAFSVFIDRRIKHEPVAYLTGTKSFFGRDFRVNPSVLIPRPATETMIEQALNIVKDSDKESTLVVDVGTGSGAIAITLAAETNLPVVAIDIDPSALQMAKSNAHTLGLEEKIEFKQGDVLEPIIRLFEQLYASGNEKISSVFPFRSLIICANLPYLSTHKMDHLDMEVRHEPIGALQAGVDGLDAYFHLLKQIKKHRDLLPRHLVVLLEIDPEQVVSITNLIRHSFPESPVRVEKDMQDLERIVVATL